MPTRTTLLESTYVYTSKKLIIYNAYINKSDVDLDLDLLQISKVRHLV